MCDDKHHNFPQQREEEKFRKLIRIKSVKRCRRVEGIYGAHREGESERKSGTLSIKCTPSSLQVPIKRELVLITHRQLHQENKQGTHCTTRSEGREKVSPTSKRVLSAAADKNRSIDMMDCHTNHK